MASKNKGSIFRDMVKKNIASQKEGGSYGYLKLPQGISLFKPEAESKVTVDFMCYKVTSKKHLDRDDESGLAIPGSIWYKRPFKTHDNVGAKNDKVVCLQTFGKKCPICEFAEEERKKGADSDTLKDLRPKNRSLYVLIPLDSKKYEKKMYLFDISDHIFQKMLNAELKEDEENMDFPDPENGKSVKLRFVEETFNGRTFAKLNRIDFVERDKQYKESVVDSVPNLDECLQELSYDEMKKKFFEIGSEEDDEEEEKPKAKPSGKAKPKPEPEEEEPEEEETEDLSVTIENADDIDDLIALAKHVDIFEDYVKELKKITQLKKLRARMLEILEESQSEAEPEEESEEVSLADLIEEADDTDSLLEIAVENPDVFKSHIKTFRSIKQLKKLKAAMLEILEPEEEEQEEPEEEEEPEEKPKKPTSKPSSGKPASSTSGDKCPSGFKFGKDFNRYDECEECPIWKECKKAKSA